MVSQFNWESMVQVQVLPGELLYFEKQTSYNMFFLDVHSKHTSTVEDLYKNRLDTNSCFVVYPHPDSPDNDRIQFSNRENRDKLKDLLDRQTNIQTYPWEES